MNRPFTESVPHLRELTSSFAESVKIYKYSALHACVRMHWHVRTYWTRSSLVGALFTSYTDIFPSLEQS